MTWAMFDDQTPDNPKLMEAGPLAGWLWFSAICWCNRHPGQNGVITTKALRALWAPYGSAQGRAQATRKLVASSLFRLMPGTGTGTGKDPCFQINDWEIYQAEAVKKSQQRRADRERKRAARAKKAAEMSAGHAPEKSRTLARARDPVPDPVPVNPPTPLLQGGDGGVDKFRFNGDLTSGEIIRAFEHCMIKVTGGHGLGLASSRQQAEVGRWLEQMRIRFPGEDDGPIQRYVIAEMSAFAGKVVAGEIEIKRDALSAFLVHVGKLQKPRRIA